MQILLGRDDVVAKVRDYIENGATWLATNGEQMEGSPSGKAVSLNQGGSMVASSPEEVPILVLSGVAGTGKSSLMAYCAKEAIAESDMHVVIHFVGATTGSTSLYGLLTR